VMELAYFSGEGEDEDEVFNAWLGIVYAGL
jgi:hypothetical protein